MNMDGNFNLTYKIDFLPIKLIFLPIKYATPIPIRTIPIPIPISSPKLLPFPIGKSHRNPIPMHTSNEAVTPVCTFRYFTEQRRHITIRQR